MNSERSIYYTDLTQAMCRQMIRFLQRDKKTKSKLKSIIIFYVFCKMGYITANGKNMYDTISKI